MARPAVPRYAWWETAIRLMIKYANLRLMTSAWFPRRLPDVLLHGLERALFQRQVPPGPVVRIGIAP